MMAVVLLQWLRWKLSEIAARAHVPGGTVEWRDFCFEREPRHYRRTPDQHRLVATPGDAINIVKRLMADPAERERLVTAGINSTAARNWPMLAGRYVEIYRSTRR